MSIFSKQRQKRIEALKGITGAGVGKFAGRLLYDLGAQSEVGGHKLTAASAPGEAITLVRSVVASYIWPQPPKLEYTGLRRSNNRVAAGTPIDQGVVTVTGTIHTGIGAPLSFDIPVEIRNGQLLEPALMIFNGTPAVISQSAIDTMVRNHSAYYTPAGREQFGPPAKMEDTIPVQRTERRTPGMFAVHASKEALREFIRTRGNKGASFLAESFDKAEGGPVEARTAQKVCPDCKRPVKFDRYALRTRGGKEHEVQTLLQKRANQTNQTWKFQSFQIAKAPKALLTHEFKYVRPEEVVYDSRGNVVPGAGMGAFREKYYDPASGTSMSYRDDSGSMRTIRTPGNEGPLPSPNAPKYFPSVGGSKGEKYGLESGEAYGGGTMQESQTEWQEPNQFVRDQEGNVVTRDQKFGILLMVAHLDHQSNQLVLGTRQNLGWYGGIAENNAPLAISEEEWNAFMTEIAPAEQAEQAATPQAPGAMDPSKISLRLGDYVTAHAGMYAGKSGFIKEIKPEQGKAIVTVKHVSPRGEEHTTNAAIPLADLTWTPKPKIQQVQYEDQDVGLDEPDEGHDVIGRFISKEDILRTLAEVEEADKTAQVYDAVTETQHEDPSAKPEGLINQLDFAQADLMGGLNRVKRDTQQAEAQFAADTGRVQNLVDEMRDSEIPEIDINEVVKTKYPQAAPKVLKQS